MAIFSVLVKESSAFRVYVKNVNGSLEGSSMVRNPFVGVVKRLEEGIYVVSLRPLWPHAYLIGLFPLAAGVVFNSVAAVAVGLLFLALGFFWSPLFFALLFHLGMRKAGHKGKVTYGLAGAAVKRWVSGTV